MLAKDRRSHNNIFQPFLNIFFSESTQATRKIKFNSVKKPFPNKVGICNLKLIFCVY